PGGAPGGDPRPAARGPAALTTPGPATSHFPLPSSLLYTSPQPHPPGARYLSMPLTRFPDHEDKRVFLSTIPALNPPPAPAAFTDRPAVAVLWLEEGAQASQELSQEFAMAVIEKGG